MRSGSVEARVGAQKTNRRNVKNITGSTTNDSSLREVIAQISKHEAVLGIMQMGSLKGKQISPHSDYDLAFILDEAAKPWYVGVTYIEDRLTDLKFVDSSEIRRILDLDAPVAHDNDLVPTLRLLRDGEILHSRSPSIRQAQEKVRTQNWIEPIDDEAAYSTWYRINFDLAHLRRMMSSTDPLYKQAVDIRMAAYGHSDLWFGCFSIRRMEFLGDKDAIHCLWEHDPEFLSAYQRFIRSDRNRDDRFAAYEEAASLATAPMGGLWQGRTTVMNMEYTLEIWKGLLGAGPSGEDAT
jgi:hypothetical protein